MLTLFSIIVLVGSILCIEEGIRKFRKKDFFYHGKKSRITLLILSALITIITLLAAYEPFLNSGLVLISLFFLGILFIYSLKYEIMTSKLTVYDVDDKEIIELINSTLAELGLKYNHYLDKDGKIIYQVIDRQTEIIVKAPTIFTSTKEVQIPSDFQMGREFFMKLKNQIKNKSQTRPYNLRGVINIVSGSGLLVFVLYLLIV